MPIGGSDLVCEPNAHLTKLPTVEISTLLRITCDEK